MYLTAFTTKSATQTLISVPATLFARDAMAMSARNSGKERTRTPRSVPN
jgi:hypothetical protein